jgi:hypothetical protein
MGMLRRGKFEAEFRAESENFRLEGAGFKKPSRGCGCCVNLSSRKEFYRILRQKICGASFIGISIAGKAGLSKSMSAMQKAKLRKSAETLHEAR